LYPTKEKKYSFVEEARAMGKYDNFIRSVQAMTGLLY
jgi:hypothetical protein